MSPRFSRLFLAGGQNAVPFSAMMDIAGLLPRWQYQPKTPPSWLARAMHKVPRASSASGPREETFEQYWERVSKDEAARLALDEEVLGA